RLPCRSNKPKSFGRKLPTGWERLAAFVVIQAYLVSRSSASPMHQRVTLPARQAYSHSASVGKRYPDRLATSSFTFIPSAYSPFALGRSHHWSSGIPSCWLSLLQWAAA